MAELEHTVWLQGVTVPFEGNGRGFGYPTANIRVDTSLAEGVYFGYADLGTFKDHPALIFVGTPITVGATEHRVEAHLLDILDQDYYNKHLALRVELFHRANKRFDSVDMLLAAIRDDDKVARSWFAKQPTSKKGAH